MRSPSRHVSAGLPVVLALLLLAGCVGIGGSNSVGPSPSSIAATALPEPEPTHIRPAVGSPGPIPSGSITVALDGETNGVTVCAGWVWVAVGAGGDAIVKIDPGSGEVLGTIEGGSNLACLDGEPWAAVDGAEVRHINEETLETLASVPVTTYYVGVGAGSVWAPSGGDVVRIDPQTAEVIAIIPIHSSDVTEVEGNDDALWATVKSADTAYRIDPLTNTVVAEIHAGAFAHGILVQPDAVWISNAHEETVARIDPVTNSVLFVDGPGSGVGLAEGNGYVWASSRGGDLFRIDPATSQATPLVHIGGWPYGIASTETALWISDGLVSVHGIPFSDLDE